MSSEELQRVFKTLADPTRLRILALLEREELAVQELMEVLGMAQSRVSRHLAILREAGLIQDRRDGTYVFYRFAVPREGAWRDAWELVGRSLREDTTADRDVAALGRVMRARAARTRSFFDAVGPEWDALRKVFDDDALRARAVARLVQPGLRVADIGTGTGILAIELARLGLHVVAVDHSARMLEAARAKLQRAGVEGVELRRGDAGALPLADGEVDAALAHMVLHYLPSPAEAVREMARCVKPGGVVVVVDFVAHEHEWMRQELGVTWLGFAVEEVEPWFTEAGLEAFRLERHDAHAGARDLPATFIASGRRPR
jgi:ubiquinone/menaquinone biosynthesis C-methylase UbiE/DNA-binding transcriptional ArsR family regulator